MKRLKESLCSVLKNDVILNLNYHDYLIARKNKFSYTGSYKLIQLILNIVIPIIILPFNVQMHE